MGITINDVRFLLHPKCKGISFSRTLTLGRLQWLVAPGAFADETKARRLHTGTLPPDAFADGFSEAFFRLLGAERTESMDVSDYEGATIVHDLNQPVPEQLKAKYSVVIDGGTLEHVFDFPTAVRNCMEMVEPGGHLISSCPTNNQMGHGFYQFSPELWFRVLSPENGFRIEHLLLYADSGGDSYEPWYEVSDPQEVQSRVTLTNALPAYLLVLARRVEVKEIFTTSPQQSDYQSTWASVKSAQGPAGGSVGTLKGAYRNLVPRSLRDLIFRVRYNARPTVRTEDLGELDARHFKRFDPD